MGINEYDPKGFQESRRKGIGGTDISAIIGINPYKTSYEVYLEKVEGYQKDFSNNKAVTRGKVFEPSIADLYEIETGKKLYCIPTITSQKHPFLIANPDRVMPAEKRGLEIKTVGKFSAKEWGESGSSEIPEHYYMQVAHYMLVLDYQCWDLAALFNDYEMRIYSFERNSKVDELILEHGEHFWKKHVEVKTPPDIDFKAPGSKDLIRSLYKEVNQETVNLTDDFIDEADLIIQAKHHLNHWEKVRDSAESKILNAMGNSEAALLSNGNKFIRKVIKRKEYTVKESEYVRLDYKKAKDESGE